MGCVVFEPRASPSSFGKESRASLGAGCSTHNRVTAHQVKSQHHSVTYIARQKKNCMSTLILHGSQLFSTLRFSPKVERTRQPAFFFLNILQHCFNLCSTSFAIATSTESPVSRPAHLAMVHRNDSPWRQSLFVWFLVCTREPYVSAMYTYK